MNMSAVQAAIDEEILAFNARHRRSSSPSSLTSTLPAFPLDVFPPWVARYASEVARAVEVPEGIVGFTLLGTLSAAYGAHLQIVLKHRYVRFCHDYFFLVADASIGKSGVFSYLSLPLYQIQSELRKRTEGDEGVNDDKPPPRPQVVISDATPEAMLKVQYENGGAAAMVSPETPLFAQLSTTGGKEWSIAPYNSSHTGEPYQVDRIMRGQNDIERARLAIITATQPETLKLVHSRPHLEASGFLSRCTFYMCPALTVDDLSPEDPEVSEELAERYERRVRELGLRYRSNTLQPLQLGAEAREARKAWIAKQHPRFKLPSGDLHYMAAHCGKLEEKIVRWAGLLHVLWREEDEREPGTLSLIDWERGLHLYDFAFAHYSAAHGLIVEAPSEAVSKKVRSYCERHRTQMIKLRDLKRHVTAFKRADDRTQEAALAQLEEDGVVRRATVQTGGRPSKVIIVL